MKVTIDKKPSIKVVLAFLIVFFVVSSAIISLGNYYSHNNSQVAGVQDAANQIKLTNDYKEAFKSEFKNYLILDTNTDWTSSSILTTTVTIKNNLLNLRVPAEFKEVHLSAVIALSEIEAGIKSQDLDLILPNIYKLRELIDNI